MLLECLRRDKIEGIAGDDFALALFHCAACEEGVEMAIGPGGYAAAVRLELLNLLPNLSAPDLYLFAHRAYIFWSLIKRASSPKGRAKVTPNKLHAALRVLQSDIAPLWTGCDPAALTSFAKTLLHPLRNVAELRQFTTTLARNGANHYEILFAA